MLTYIVIVIAIVH